MDDRENISESLRNAVDGGLPDGTMLIGWVMVAEWIDPDGNRMLTQMHGSSAGGELPEWQRDGYLLSALKGNWNDPNEESE